MTDIPEWETQTAIETIAEILANHFSEDEMSDDACEKVAKAIVARLEQGP